MTASKIRNGHRVDSMETRIDGLEKETRLQTAKIEKIESTVTSIHEHQLAETIRKNEREEIQKKKDASIVRWAKIAGVALAVVTLLELTRPLVTQFVSPAAASTPPAPAATIAH